MVVYHNEAVSVCDQCGNSIQYMEAFTTNRGYICFEGLWHTKGNSASAYKHMVHFSERISQWTCTEPGICSAHRTLLLDAFDRLAPNLQTNQYKQLARSLIQEAGLSSRKYLEKYLSIFVMVGGKLPVPRPSQALVEDIKSEIKTIIKAWNQYVTLLPKKRTIISINIILLVCVLRVAGQKVFDMYYHELPITKADLLRNIGLFQTIMLSDWGVFPIPMRPFPSPPCPPSTNKSSRLTIN